MGAISDTENADSGEDVDEPELITSNDVVDPQQVEENDVQGYSTSNEPEPADIMNDGSEIVLDDLAIDPLITEDTKPLISTGEAQKLIPEDALKVLKEKFNGHIENCRPIQDFDRLI